MFLPYITQYCLNNPDEKDPTAKILAKLAKQLAWVNWNEDETKAANIVIDKIKQLQKDVALPSKLADTGVSREEMDKNMGNLINLCFQSSSLTMAPRSANAEELQKLFEYAYEGKDVDF